MIAEIWWGDECIAEIEAEPVCGEDFCDGCGDCLACQRHDLEDWCSAGSSRWVIYADGPGGTDNLYEYSNSGIGSHIEAIRSVLRERGKLP